MIIKKSFLLSVDLFYIFTNSEDPDEMQHYSAFHLGLHCLQNYSLRGFPNKCVKENKILRRNCLALCVLMGSPMYFDTINLEC